MKTTFLRYGVLFNLILAALAKGGGGKGGGGSSGGSSGGSGGSKSGGGTSGGSSGGSSGSTSSGGKVAGGGSGTFSGTKTGSVSNAGSYNFPSGSTGYSRGGYGSYSKSTVGTSAAYTRGTYTNYYPTYGGGYGYGYPYGWYGFYNPAFLYWAIIPIGFYGGYHMTYGRYNAQSGAYYAPQLTSQNSGSADVMINGTAYTADDNNYHYTYGLLTSTGRPALDAAFYASSDNNASPADFAYRLTFWQLVEFTDANNNGVLDDGEAISSSVPLQGGWSTIQISNKTSSANASLTYLEGQTSSVITTSNNSTFNASLVFRVSNLQINNTFALTYEPNSAEYEFSIQGYQPVNQANKLALLQVLSNVPTIPTATDINSTTPADVVAQIKTNETYGLSIGGYSEGRLEYSNQTNFVNVTFGNYSSQASQQVLSSLTPLDNWIWNGASPNETSVLAVTLSALNNGSATVAGFAFMDVDVLGVGATGAGNSFFSGSKASSLAITGAAVFTLVFVL